MRAAGAYLIEAAVQIVLDALAANPAGLTNVEVAMTTGLDLHISNQNGYISWTILQWLVESGRVKKGGRTYTLVQPL
jgi:hypothetical protein